MPHAISWLLPDRIIYFRVYGTVTPEELPQTDSEVLSLLESTGDARVHILFDDSDLEKMPGITDMLKLKYIRHAKTGWIITPQSNRLIRFVGSVVGQTVGANFRFVDNLENGLTTLTKMDLSLPDVPTLAAHLKTVRDKAQAV